MAEQLNQDFLKEIKEQLAATKEKLEKELATFTRKNPHNTEDYDADFPDIGEDEDDNASEVAQYSYNLTLERTLENTLRDINTALKRIKEGTYGICRHCKKPIDKKRLLARPASSACVSCKQRLALE